MLRESESSPDMVQDMKAADWFVAKVRAGDRYAQNLYAAMCNMYWQKLEVMPLLKNQLWSCSWRSSGGIVAELRDCGESYMDWYCSGMRNDDYQKDTDVPYPRGYVGEGHVTEEIAQDLHLLGWVPVPYDDNDLI